jgi:formylmethanofuran dehydrogenase subunit E
MPEQKRCALCGELTDDPMILVHGDSWVCKGCSKDTQTQDD